MSALLLLCAALAQAPLEPSAPVPDDGVADAVLAPDAGILAPSPPSPEAVAPSDDAPPAGPTPAAPPPEPPPAEDVPPPTVSPAPEVTPAPTAAADGEGGAEARAATTEPAEPPEKFVKGELSAYLGGDRLVVKNTRFGVSAGVDRFGDVFYLLVEPLVDLRFLDGALGIGLGVPLRLELISFETDPATNNPKMARDLGRLRREDWDSVHDFGRLLKYVTYGRKEDTLFVSVGQRYASSIGHGAITRRYSPSIDVDYPRVAAQVDAYNRFGGFEVMVNDVLAWNQLSGLAFIKPFSFFDPSSEALRSFSVGVSAGVDWDAPRTLVIDGGLRQLDAQGRLEATRRPVALVGVDAEVKVLKTRSADIKPWVDVSMLLGGDLGVTAGVLGRFNVGTKTVNAFRVILEARYLGDRYAPGYFDSFYEVERFMFRELPRVDPTVANFAPKQTFVLEQGLGERFGYYAEGSWGIPGAVGLTLAIQGVSNAPAKDFVAHLEVPVLSFFQLFASYYLRGVERMSELTGHDDDGSPGFFGDKAVAFAGARLRVLPFLFINGRAYKTFRMNPGLQRYDNQFGFVIDLEVGYELRPKKEAPLPAEGAGGFDPRWRD